MSTVMAPLFDLTQALPPLIDFNGSYGTGIYTIYYVLLIAKLVKNIFFVYLYEQLMFCFILGNWNSGL